MIKAINTDDAEVRSEAIRALGDFGDAPEVQSLIKNTIDGMSITNLDGPIQFLTLLGQAAVEPAIELLRKDTDELPTHYFMVVEQKYYNK